MSCKLGETICNMHNTFGPGTTNECQRNSGSKSFEREMRALKMRSTMAGHQKLTRTKFRAISKLILLNYMRSCWRTNVDHSTVINIWSKLERWKTLIRECLMSWAKEGNGTPLQYSCLENPMDRGAWRAAVHETQRVGHDGCDSAHTHANWN